MTKLESQLQLLLAGTQKSIPSTSMVDINGQQMKQADIVAKLQGWIQLLVQKDAAKVPYNTALLAVQAVAPDAHLFKVAYGQALKQVLGKDSPLLADFGLGTPQRKTQTATTRVLAQAKAQATRKARGTLGSVQKKAIKGPGVTSVTVPSSGPSVVVPAASTAGAAEPALGPAPNTGAGK
jgi:hypothetical protein